MPFNRYNVSVRRSLVLFAVATASLLVLGPAQGAFPGSNGLIAYSCNSNQVCTVNPDGSNAKTLVSSGSDPAWSPGGSKIAYVTGGSIYTANADGSNAVDFVDTASEPTWSSDGSSIAFVDAGNRIAIKGSGSVRELTTTNAIDPAISPNGQSVAYAQLVSGNYELFTVGVAAGSTPTQLTTESYDHTEPTWSPDGSKLLFEDPTGLATVSSSGGASTQLVTADAQDPSYSPDGTKIAYATSSGSLVVASANGSNGTAIVSSLADASLPDWGSAAQSGSSTPPPPSDTIGGPTNTSYPVITLASGDSTPIVGHTLTASTGTWTGTFPISYAYQWKRCDAADPVNGSCVNISGATSSSYTVQPADYKSRIRVAVSASNSDGRHTQNSEVTAPTDAIPARVTTTPAISAVQPVVDSPLTLSAGVWAGSTPIAYTYSWRRCNPVGDLVSCLPITGATMSTYTPTVADIGFSLRVWITGANLAGTDTAITNHTYPVIDKKHFAPTASISPAIGGTALPGRQLTANIGTFTGDAPIATSFRWFRCDANGEACHAIGGATKVVYFPTADDVGFTLRLFVTATNAYGTLLAKSGPTDTVAAEPPHIRGRRIVGTNRADYLAGGGHDDVIIGLGGNDTILGGAGDDRLYGGAGNDVIVGGAGADTISGGPGSDTIYANDGERDVVDCGPGNDRAIVDPYDIVENCEVVDRRATP